MPGWVLRPLSVCADPEWPANCLPPPMVMAHHLTRRALHPLLTGHPRNQNVLLLPKGDKGEGVSHLFPKGRAGATLLSHRPKSLKRQKMLKNLERLPPQLSGLRERKSLKGPPRDLQPPHRGQMLDGNHQRPQSPPAGAPLLGRPLAAIFPGRSHLPWKARSTLHSPRILIIFDRS